MNTSSNYRYDNHGRLQNAESSVWGQGYGYDGFGNLVAQTVTKGAAFSPEESVDPLNNWLLDDISSYDANGNTTRLPGLRLTYDTDNRLTQATGPGGSEQYRYDHKNLRVWKQNADGTENFYFYDESAELAEYTLATDAAGDISFQLQKSHIYFGGSMVESGGEVTVVDRLGATRGWSTHQGAQSASYLPFGQKAAGSAAGLSRFGGYERDATGLDYAQQRYYSSTLGRFISPDPYAGSAHAGDPDSWNRYAFVNNDPMDETDPTGLCTNDSTGQCQTQTPQQAQQAQQKAAAKAARAQEAQNKQQLKDKIGHGCTAVSGLLLLGDAAILFSGQEYLVPAALSLSFHVWAACGVATW